MTGQEEGTAVEAAIKSTIDAPPNIEGLWKGIGGSIDSITPIICEFIDNSIACYDVYRTRDPNIDITIQQTAEGVRISIKDNGAGIQDLATAFGLGYTQNTSAVLNEHGFGMKHALAAVDPENKNWKVLTKSIPDGSGYREIRAPYDFKLTLYTHIDNPQESMSQGTLIDFTCTHAMFLTAARHANIKNIAEAFNSLKEDLAYIYNDVKSCSIRVSFNGSPLSSLPKFAHNWDTLLITPRTCVEVVRAGEAPVNVDYSYGTIHSCDKEHADSFYNVSCRRNQGIEIRFNGRIIARNLIDEIYSKDHHDSQNRIIGTFNLITSDPDSLPKTTTNKNGLNPNDPATAKLYEIIRKLFPSSDFTALKSKNINNYSEAELEKSLYDIKRTDIDKEDWCERQFDVFTKSVRDRKSRPKADLVTNLNGRLDVYECKKDSPAIYDLYQLLMYWDGLVSDGKTPNKGRLVGSSFTTAIRNHIKEINERVDAAGNNYKFELKSWKDLGVTLK